MPESPHLDRRQFVNVVLAFLGSVMGAVIGLPAIGYLISPASKVQKKESWISAGPLEKYPIGTPVLFSFTRTTINGWEKTVNSHGVFVTRFSPDQVRVFSNICTHLSCRVNWRVDEQDYACPCHEAHFDIEGNVLSGPPPRPLDVYENKIEEGNLLFNFKEG
jgi:Rieske Fe-S protein